MSITVSRVSKRLGGRRASPGFQLGPIDLTVRDGEAVALVGPNGAGKTTILLLAVGLLNPDAGHVLVDGRPPADFQNLGRLGFLPEILPAHADWTIQRFLTFHASLFQGATARGVKLNVQDLLHRVDLWSKRKRRIGQLSMGMKQRLLVAHAFLNKPRWLVLDEPTANLDPDGVFLLRGLVEEAVQGGAAVLQSSHRLDEVERTCHRAALIRDGKLVDMLSLRKTKEGMRWAAIRLARPLEEVPSSVRSRCLDVETKDKEIRVKVASEEQVSEVIQDLLHAGATVLEVTTSLGDLEARIRGERPGD